jgi:MFS transporter, DHA2 family, multidrug resistance protein
MVRSPHHFFRRHLVKSIPAIHHEHASYKWWILLNIMIGTFIAVLDVTIVNVGLPKIMASLGATVEKAEWVITAYSLVFAIMLPTSGWIADHFGYKRTYFSALFFFTLGSFLCGFAWNENALIFARVIQGAGGGALMPVGMAIVMREFPLKQRGMALGFWGISAAASISFGPLIGGWLIDNISWNAIFDVNVPVGILGMLFTLIVQREYRTEHVRSFDFLGFISMSVGLTALLLALAEGNASWNTGGWTSPFIVTCFVVAFLGLLVFIFTELKTKDPLILLSLFKDFNFAATNAVLFIFGVGMFGSTFLMPLYLQTSLGYTALMAGMVFLPVGLIQAFVGPVSGIMADRLDPRVPSLIGILLLAYSLYMNSFLSMYSESAQIMIPLIIRAVGMGLLFTPLSTIALANIPKHNIAQASGLFNVIRQIGGAFGVAVFGTILTTKQLYHLSLYGQSVNRNSPQFAEIARNLRFFVQHRVGGTVADVTTQANIAISSHVAQQAFIRAVDDAFFISSIITIVGLLPIMFFKGKKKKEAGAAPEFH